MAFTAQDVKNLREQTGCGMMDCKKALTEAGGDFDKAVEILRIKGAKDVGKRAERTAAEGLIAVSGHTMIEINSETDFVAKNSDFIEFANRVAAAAAAAKANSQEELANADLDGLLEPVSGEGASAAVEAVKGRTEALLEKFRAFSTRPKQGAADPAAP